MVTYYLSARSTNNRLWLPGAIFTSGLAAAFKYPGASALIMPLAAAFLLDPAQRSGRVKIFMLGLPLFAVGFAAAFPSLLLSPQALYHGLTAEVGYKVASGSAQEALLRMIRYPWYVTKATGAVFMLWALAAVVYSLVRPRRETWVLLVWLVPYAAVMASSSMVVIRYMVPEVPVLGLLMARLSSELWVNAAALRRRVIYIGTLVALLAVILATLVHFKALLSPDPRDRAAEWISNVVLSGNTVAITPSHNGDAFSIASIDPRKYSTLRLDMRADRDVSTYINLPFRFLAANERAWQQLDSPKHPSHDLFWREVMESGRFELKARFQNRPAWPGVLLYGRLPEDLNYIYQETRIYRRIN
jgi:4-amino-4-deoxy-L-arabinose transferase-like glycosyltransferase